MSFHFISFLSFQPLTSAKRSLCHWVKQRKGTAKSRYHDAQASSLSQETNRREEQLPHMEHTIWKKNWRVKLTVIYTSSSLIFFIWLNEAWLFLAVLAILTSYDPEKNVLFVFSYLSKRNRTDQVYGQPDTCLNTEYTWTVRQTQYPYVLYCVSPCQSLWFMSSVWCCAWSSRQIKWLWSHVCVWLKFHSAMTVESPFPCRVAEGIEIRSS